MNGMKVTKRPSLFATVSFALCLGFAPSIGFSFADDIDSAFDREIRDPIRFLIDAYSAKDVLVLENSNHVNYKIYDQILALLRKVGTDENLKYVVLERFHDASEFYRALSVNSLETAIPKLGSAYAKRNSLCTSPEWAYVIAKVMPEMRRINRLRPPENPLIVTSIDELTAERDVLWPASLDKGFSWDAFYKRTKVDWKPNCESNSYSNSSIVPILATSRTRESGTADRFIKFMERLGPRRKAIVMYHFSHAIRGVQSCSPELNADSTWTVAQGPESWMQIALNKNRRLGERIFSVLFDEISRSNPNGVLTLSAREAKRHPGRDFGVSLRNLSGLSSKRGMGLFQPNSFLFGYNASSTDAALDDLFDGVVWNHDSSERYRLSEKASDYLPAYCEPDA